MNIHPRLTILVAMLIPAIVLGALLLPAIGEWLPAFTVARLPTAGAHLAVVGAPLLCCVSLDRAHRPRVRAALHVVLLLTLSALATALVAHSLYPLSFDVLRLIPFATLATLSGAGLAIGARATGARPGVATAVFIAGCTLPPLLMFESSAIAHNPIVLLQGLSPSWAWHAGAAAPWEFVILGAAGWCVALWREGCIRARARRFRRRQ